MQEIVTKKMGYRIPTPIQAYTIPAVLSGADVIGIAQTGEYLLGRCEDLTHTNIGARLRKDCCLPDARHLAPVWQGEEALRASPRPYRTGLQSSHQQDQG